MAKKVHKPEEIVSKLRQVDFLHSRFMANRVWSYDFVHDRTHDGRVFRTLNLIDEHTNVGPAIRINLENI